MQKSHLEFAERRGRDGEHRPEVDLRIAAARTEQLIVEAIEARRVDPVRVPGENLERQLWPPQVPELDAACEQRLESQPVCRVKKVADKK